MSSKLSRAVDGHDKACSCMYVEYYQSVKVSGFYVELTLAIEVCVHIFP